MPMWNCSCWTSRGAFLLPKPFSCAAFASRRISRSATTACGSLCRSSPPRSHAGGRGAAPTALLRRRPRPRGKASGKLRRRRPLTMRCVALSDAPGYARFRSRGTKDERRYRVVGLGNGGAGGLERVPALVRRTKAEVQPSWGEVANTKHAPRVVPSMPTPLSVYADVETSGTRAISNRYRNGLALHTETYSDRSLVALDDLQAHPKPRASVHKR